MFALKWFQNIQLAPYFKAILNVTILMCLFYEYSTDSVIDSYSLH